MIVVIQCAAKKKPEAGHLRRRDGQKVLFVADPENAPAGVSCAYARPDDIADTGISWRTELLKYNDTPGNNPRGLLPAWQLYGNRTYKLLADRFGLERIYILSAGWGLIAADFLTPAYDITFSATVKKKAPYKYRKKADRYDDLCMLPHDTDEPIVFFGGKDYLPLFRHLTQPISAPRTVFYRSAVKPNFPGVSLINYHTDRRTNWHYECAQAFLEGRIDIRG